VGDGLINTLCAPIRCSILVLSPRMLPLVIFEVGSIANMAIFFLFSNNNCPNLSINVLFPTPGGLYGQLFNNENEYGKIKNMVESFAENEGRQPRILIAKVGQDGHDRGAKVVASAFSDLGFDVDMAPLFSMPSEVAKMAIENDVHVIGISTLAGGHKTIIEELKKSLDLYKAKDILIVAGGVIPKKDYDYLKKLGVVAIFGPGTTILQSAKEILDKLNKMKHFAFNG